MGIASSKVCRQVSQKDLQEGSIPSTPILTPKVTKHEDLDPRSPSLHISRTPLQLLSAANLKFHEFEETELIAAADDTPAKPKTVFLGIDPRSPTLEFKRTPIVIVSESDTGEKIHNKNLERVKRSVIISTPKSTPKKRVSGKMSANVPPKLLESSPAKVKSDAIKRKSFVGLLETNIDYTETDLDEVIREKCKAKEIQHDLNPATPNHKQLIAVIEKENIDPRSPTNDFLRTPIQIIKKITDLDLNDVVDYEIKSRCIGKEGGQNEIAAELEDHKIIEKCVQEICETVHLTSEQQAIFHNEDRTNVEIPGIDMPNARNADKEIEIIQSDDTVITQIPVETKSAPITPPACDNNLKLSPRKELKPKSAPVTPPVNLAADVKEFDKKLTSLIYHDEDIVICPRKVKLKDYDSRSPLRNINSNEPEKKKSSQKIKVKENMKSEYAVSRIPVFKEKGKKTEIQCENTPPRNMEKRKVKPRRSRWDNADATLII